MKIDKVIFACSDMEEYSSFWNMQAKLWKVGIGIHPVCLLFGKKSNTDMSEEHGEIIEMEYIPELGSSVNSRGIAQLTWSKFHYPTTEPDTTWLVGDMDLLPLQRHHFTSLIESIPDNSLVHLNAGGISSPRLGYDHGFLHQGPQRVAQDQGRGGGADLPGHYHVGKGSTFRVFTQGRTFEEQVRYIIESDRYGLGPCGRSVPADQRDTNAYWYYWCAEENYSSELIWNAIHRGELTFTPFYFNNANNTDRIGRDGWVPDRSDYIHDPTRLHQRQIKDAHCVRPYSKQKDAIERIINHSGLLA